MMFSRAPYLAILLLGGALILAWLLPDLAWQTPEPVRPAIEALRIESPALATGGGGEMLARPPFWATRRPAPDAPNGPAVADLDGLKVVGVVRLGDRIVLIANHAQGALRVVAGQSYGEWLFEGIEDDAAVFRRGDERHRIRMPRVRVEELPGREATQ